MANFKNHRREQTMSPFRISVFVFSALFLSAGASVDCDGRWTFAAYADEGEGGDGGDGGDGDGGDGGGDDGDDGGADDDGDDAGDDDDDDDDDDDGPARSGVRRLLDIFDRSTPSRPAAPRARQAPRASEAAGEIVATGLEDDDIARLVELGYSVLSRQQLQAPVSTLARLRIRTGITLDEARAEVSGISATARADFNHYYRTSAPVTPAPSPSGTDCSGPGCAARKLIGWPIAPGAREGCGAGARIGLVDTGINPEHLAFKGGRLEVIDSPVEGEGVRKSSRRHGTAVASILIGSAESRTPGLLPEATVIAVDAFYRGKGNDERSDLFTLVKAIDLVSQRNVDIINMSLSGPPNTVLEQTIANLEEDNVLIVAAAGNMGPNAKPVYPAAYPGVIAVTAVDHRGRIYRRAGRGEHIDISGPGVEVWIAASISGARFATGTSYAVPFITAATALALDGQGSASHDEVLAALAQAALDLGEPGRDDVYGHGLLQAAGLCG
ncbi:S8 family serine peptidase [Hoeflea poritis]|uniref:S8 family serine peptidase n=1 Tax=Hoeflea poritis TaxID=2993659 RepID=A0ABT4VHT7_9HYPH|nr:S8 family serine peptidase [Hoeflea poritis]MDA4844279.1 S8 family serine peptidase [Hoeflea poritis]